MVTNIIIGDMSTFPTSESQKPAWIFWCTDCETCKERRTNHIGETSAKVTSV